MKLLNPSLLARPFGMAGVFHVAVLAVALAATLRITELKVAAAGNGPGQSSIDQAAVDRAHNFLKTADRGRGVLGIVHLGARFQGHTYKETRTVIGQPGHFGLVYTYKWEDDGVTELAFLCDSKGSVYGVQVLKHNAVVQQPYLFANASIAVIGNLVLEAFREKMTPQEIQQVRQFIDNPNARGILEMSLKLQQAFGN